MLKSLLLLIPLLILPGCDLLKQNKRKNPNTPAEQLPTDDGTKQEEDEDLLPFNSNIPVTPSAGSGEIDVSEVMSFEIDSAASLDNLTVSARYKLNGKITYKNGDKATVSDGISWQVTPEELATISAEGELQTLEKVGPITIIGKWKSLEAKLVLQIKDLPPQPIKLQRVEIALKKADAVLMVGNEIELEATGIFDDRSQRVLVAQWLIKEGSGLGAFMAPGLLKLTAAGKIVVEAAFGDGEAKVTDTFELEIVKKPVVLTALEIDNFSATPAQQIPNIPFGELLPLKVSGVYDDGSRQLESMVQWEVLAITDASIPVGAAKFEGDSLSTLNPTAVGRIKIKATANGKTLERTVQIVPAQKILIQKAERYVINQDNTIILEVALITENGQQSTRLLTEALTWKSQPNEESGVQISRNENENQLKIRSSKVMKVKLQLQTDQGLTGETEIDFEVSQVLPEVAFSVHKYINDKLLFKTPWPAPTPASNAAEPAAQVNDMIFSSAALPNYVKECETKAIKGAQDLVYSPEVDAKLRILHASSLSMVHKVSIRINSIENPKERLEDSRKDLIALDRDAYFYYLSYERERARPVLAFENFRDGYWVFEVIALPATPTKPASCLLPDKAEALRYLDYVIKRSNKPLIDMKRQGLAQ